MGRGGVLRYHIFYRENGQVPCMQDVDCADSCMSNYSPPALPLSIEVSVLSMNTQNLSNYVPIYHPPSTCLLVFPLVSPSGGTATGSRKMAGGVNPTFCIFWLGGICSSTSVFRVRREKFRLVKYHAWSCAYRVGRMRGDWCGLVWFWGSSSRWIVKGLDQNGLGFVVPKRLDVMVICYLLHPQYNIETQHATPQAARHRHPWNTTTLHKLSSSLASLFQPHIAFIITRN